jgi:hypothetical protein
MVVSHGAKEEEYLPAYQYDVVEVEVEEDEPSHDSQVSVVEASCLVLGCTATQSAKAQSSGMER